MDLRRGRAGDASRRGAGAAPRAGQDAARLRDELALRHPRGEAHHQEGAAPSAPARGAGGGDRLAGVQLVALPRRPRQPGAADRGALHPHAGALSAAHARPGPSGDPRRGGGRERAARPPRPHPLRPQQRERAASVLHHARAARRRALLRDPAARVPAQSAEHLAPPGSEDPAAVAAHPPRRADLAGRGGRLHAPPRGRAAARLLAHRPRAVPVPRRRRAGLLQPRAEPLRPERARGGLRRRLLLPSRPCAHLQGADGRLLHPQGVRQPLPRRPEFRLHGVLPRRADGPSPLHAEGARVRLLSAAGRLHPAQAELGLQPDRPHRLARHTRTQGPPLLRDQGSGHLALRAVRPPRGFAARRRDQPLRPHGQTPAFRRASPRHVGRQSRPSLRGEERGQRRPAHHQDEHALRGHHPAGRMRPVRDIHHQGAGEVLRHRGRPVRPRRRALRLHALHLAGRTVVRGVLAHLGVSRQRRERAVHGVRAAQGRLRRRDHL